MRIAHISDIHLRSFSGFNPLDYLNKRAIGAANLILRRSREFPHALIEALVADINSVGPDHLLVTGDLSNLSLPAEFAAAKRMLSQVRLPTEEVTVVPGNHDYYIQSSQLPGDFYRAFAPYMRGDIGGSERSPFPFVRLRGDVALLALSTAQPSAPLLATGELGERQLADAANLLQDARVRERFRLVAMHHPPRVGPRHWAKRLIDAAAFQQMIAANGADLIVHGHLHRLQQYDLAGPTGPVPVIGITSGTWMSPNPERLASYLIYEIVEKKLVQVIQRRYSRQSSTFDDEVVLQSRAA